MTRDESTTKLACLVLDLPNWFDSTEDYVQEKLGKPLEECSDFEITDLLMDVLPKERV